ncbi:hypothetical protein [Roseomonas haemaphysalidis]|uniref:Uncharacterized protein n=1 Tax=Roseomonas haemaphysalidis TaxID=2768162 RepID=A0ABS3KW72_9PROT|nr:hypothetical protein [Roseomonas haemaphysalidis]MBO1080868.1 hypothetical protein [Roseomonas haemaphysalidis]
MTTISRMNFGVPVIPTVEEYRAAYKGNGDRVPHDLDAATGIINAAILGFWTFVVVSWGISSWV